MRIVLSLGFAGSGLKREVGREIGCKTGNGYKSGYGNVSGNILNTGIENKSGTRYKAGNKNTEV